MRQVYEYQLKDPRWQKMRLEILERAEFICEVCGDGTSTLHVHHGYYRSKADPWEYPANSLHYVCESCHQMVQMATAEIHERLALMPPELLYDVVRLLEDYEKSWPFHYVVRDYERWQEEHPPGNDF